MKTRLISIILTLAAAASLLTGCTENETGSYAAFLNSETYSENTHETISEIISSETIVENIVENVETSPATQEVFTDDIVFSDSMPMGEAEAVSAPETIANLNNETFLKYTTINPKYKPSGSKYVYCYNFNTVLSTGFGEDGLTVPTEAYYGINGKINGRTVSASVYNHTDKISLKSMYVENMDAGNADITNLGKKTSVSIDTSSYANGLYRVLADFNNNTTAKLYFYVNGNKTYLCQIETITAATAKDYIARRNDLADVLDKGNVTPKNSLSLENVWYPFYEFDENYRCDTQRWIDLSNELIDDNWSDEYKFFVLADWIRNNIAYDEYKSNSTHGASRARYYKDFSGKYSTYDTKSGVCFDYVNIVTIMCRAHDIPCITIGSKEYNHVWNAVHVNNRWIEYDACSSEKYHVKKDTSIKIASNEMYIYRGFYDVIPNTTTHMPTDATANQYFQQNSYIVY